MAQTVIQVDAFTSKPFAGNPAAVCVMERAADEAWMQRVALEMNLSETAFVYPTGKTWHLRWFTPAAEVELCGHATLATAHVLFTEGHAGRGEPINFDTHSGRLTATLNRDWIELDFPPLEPLSEAPPNGLAEAVGVTAKEITRWSWNWIIEVDTPETVVSAKPDFLRLVELKARGVIVTAQDVSGQYDFVSRYFAPMIGINEDPVTGSAHCALTPYWAAKLGKREMFARQVSARGGDLRLKLNGDRVTLSGQAVTVMRGELV